MANSLKGESTYPRIFSIRLLGLTFSSLTTWPV